MKNTEIRLAVVAANVKLWEVAEALGIADNSLSRKLRRELPDEEKKRILAVIERLKAERVSCNV